MGEPILEIINVSKSFGNVNVLQNLNFSCDAGEVHVLVGENGAGKSTLLKIISGLYKADSGTIMFKGKKVNFRTPQDAQKAGIAMVYQELTVLPEMTVTQNVFLNNEVRNPLGIIDNKSNRRNVVEMIEKYNIEVDPDDLVRDLPIAKQQMVEILKVLVRDPAIIILDEPTSSLAIKEVKKLYQIINTLTGMGKTIIFISHRMEEVFHIGGRATVLKDGCLVATVNLSEIGHDDLIKLMVGRPLQMFFPPKLTENSGEKVFEVMNLNIAKKLHDISFSVKKGEVLGVAGLQGHGQTELLDTLAGALHRDSGRIFVNSREVRIHRPIQAIRAGITLVPQDRKIQGLLLSLSVKENLLIECLHLHQFAGFIKTRESNKLSDGSIKQLSIKVANANQRVSNLSGGNQQKVVLGKGLSIAPKVLLFNEPTRGIDVKTKLEFYQMMRDLAGRGVAVIMYSSDLMEVVGMSDRVLVMCEGRITAEITKDDINEEVIMRGAVGMSNAGSCA